MVAQTGLPASSLIFLVPKVRGSSKPVLGLFPVSEQRASLQSKSPAINFPSSVQISVWPGAKYQGVALLVVLFGSSRFCSNATEKSQQVRPEIIFPGQKAEVVVPSAV